MRLSPGVFDVWTFRRDLDATKYLLLRTSQLKADRYFNGGRFWQIPSNFVKDGETIEQAVIRCLDTFGLIPKAIWAAEYAYTIYNRRFREMQLIGVYAVEVSDTEVRINNEEHSEFAWYSFGECLERIHYRGLKDGLQSVSEYITGVDHPAPELCLYEQRTS